MPLELIHIAIALAFVVVCAFSVEILIRQRKVQRTASQDPQARRPFYRRKRHATRRSSNFQGW